jgi:hypothetical protein
MALLAINLLVLAFQLEICFTMVEILNAFDNAEGLPCMALSAILPEFIIVGIRVARGAVFIFQSGEFLEFLPVFCNCFMTRRTGHLLVFPGKLKPGFGVAEFRSRLKLVKVMTTVTIGRKCLLMVIGMTGQACLA